MQSEPKPRRWHPPPEVQEALELLTDEDFLRLEAVARALASVLRRDSSQYRDLLQEAFVRTLEGDRRWRKDLDLYRHLAGTMRSIASSWAKSKQEQPWFESELTGGTYGDEPQSPFDQGRDETTDLERQFAAKQEIKVICRLFAGENLALAVLDCWLQGMNGPETQKKLGIAEHNYRAVARGIRRRLSRSRRAEVDDG